jgi:hypothetical protein
VLSEVFGPDRQRPGIAVVLADPVIP